MRNYDAAQSRRGNSGWAPGNTGPTGALAGSLPALRARARDLDRNNGYYRAAVRTLVQHEIGAGITPSSNLSQNRVRGSGLDVAAAKRVDSARDNMWLRWAETTLFDFDGRQNVYGLQALARRTAINSGECLLRERVLSAADARRLGSPLRLQYQILEGDFLDTSRDGPRGDGSVVIQGIEFDRDGRRTAYWLHRTHPGEGTAWNLRTGSESVRVPAAEIVHLFRQDRPGQMRGVPEGTAAIIALQDLADYAEAWLMRGKIEACLGVIIHDATGSEAAPNPITAAQAGQGDEAGLPQDPTISADITVSPGMVMQLPAGKTVTTLSPSSSGGQVEFMRQALRSVAAAFGVGYDQVSTDTSQANYSSTRAARLQLAAQVEQTQWHLLIPTLCQPVWAAMCRIGFIQGLWVDAPALAEWQPPPMPVVEPAVDYPAIRDAVRSNLLSLRKAILQQGYNPEHLLAEIASFQNLADKLGVVGDADPRRTSQQGQIQAALAPTDKAAPPTAPTPETPAPADKNAPAGEE